MSEIDNLVEELSFTIQDAEVIPTPIDPTLSNEGEAADAKATGDAIAEVIDNLKVNGKSATTSGDYKVITVYAGDIAMSSDAGAQTVAQAIENAGNKDASDIMYDTENLVTVKSAIDGIITDMDSELSEAEIDGIFEEVFGGDE